MLIKGWLTLQTIAITGKDKTWRRKPKGGWRNLCTQFFLCAEYQWRTTTRRQRIKASFHSLAFPLTEAQTARLTCGKCNKKLYFAFLLWVSGRMSNYLLTKLFLQHRYTPHFDRCSDRSFSAYFTIAGLVPSAQCTFNCWSQCSQKIHFCCICWQPERLKSAYRLQNSYDMGSLHILPKSQHKSLLEILFFTELWSK